MPGSVGSPLCLGGQEQKALWPTTEHLAPGTQKEKSQGSRHFFFPSVLPGAGMQASPSAHSASERHQSVLRQPSTGSGTWLDGHWQE